MSTRTLLVLLIVGALLAACTIPIPVPDFVTVRGSGNSITKTYDFSDFDSVVIANAFQAEITASDNYAVEVTVDDNVVEHLRVEQRGRTVTVSLAPNLSLNNTILRARVTLPRLVNLDASGATRVGVSGFKTTDAVRVKVSGASTIKGDMATGDLSAEVSGASTLNVSGSGKHLNVNASGASTADLSDFAVTDATIEASGASRVQINASGKLDARASGASSVRYEGNPTLGHIDESGASSISPR